jgi:hypothetical protein
LLDIYHPPPIAAQDISQSIQQCRPGIGPENLCYGAAYFPWVQTTFNPFIDQNDPAVLIIRRGSVIPAPLV